MQARLRRLAWQRRHGRVATFECATRHCVGCPTSDPGAMAPKTLPQVHVSVNIHGLLRQEARMTAALYSTGSTLRRILQEARVLNGLVWMLVVASMGAAVDTVGGVGRRS